METSEVFTVGSHRYEIKMWTESDGEKWYEIWQDGNIVGERNRWPIDRNTTEPLTKKELLDDRKAMLIEQQRRKEEVDMK